MFSVSDWFEASCSRAASAADCAAARPLLAAASCAVTWLNSSWPTAPVRTSGARRATSSWARSTSLCARAVSASRAAICAFSEPLLTYIVRTSRTVCASCASACSSATWASAGSSRTSDWPALTKSVSSALMATTVPETCGVTWTTLACT